MVIKTLSMDEIRDAAKANIIAEYLYCAFGTGTANPDPSVQTLSGEILRSACQEITSTTNSVTASGFVSASQGNGSVFGNSGIFNSSSYGEMKSENTFSSTIIKTTDKEVWVDTTVSLQVLQP
jgi:hypothetical protein